MKESKFFKIKDNDADFVTISRRNFNQMKVDFADPHLTKLDLSIVGVKKKRKV
ncbi:hypothetical protein LCGC14_0909530 [marine sediment metagenome]|uniref:Uncharacterized protein n=1 Tax=marine sediment metagenome TaxID=412755 RepID=A0A0F9PES3_9ZZZZ